MSSPTIPDASLSDAIVSPSGLIHVLGYTPAEGERGVPITVRIHFRPELADAMYVRLVVGHKAVATTVRELPNVVYGRWELDAIAPPFDHEQHTSSRVLISVQALNNENTVLDSVAFGEFCYWAPTCTPDRILASQPSSGKAPKPEATGMRRRGATISHVPMSAAERAALTQPKVRLHRRAKTQTIVRSNLKQSSVPAEGAKLTAQTPILQLVTPLDTVVTGWSQTEYSAGRRLVRFSKVQDGRKLIVSCEPIRQEDYCEADTVISCIYREETDSCFITSVDVIYLLERLTNGEFPVEEKNRIRRNLEGLRPTTVSKHKPGFGEFFQRIMEFPDPKPRNIEKDLKVFDWHLLGQALEKILSKYSIFVAPDEEESVSGSSSSVSDPSPLESPELAHMQLSYPSSSDAVKFEASSSDPQPLPTMIQGDSYLSPIDSSNSSSSAVYPAFVETVNINVAAPPDPVMAWHNGLKNSLPSMDNFSVLTSYHDGMDPMDNIQGYHQEASAMDFNIYNDYSFPSMADDSMVNEPYVI